MSRARPGPSWSPRSSRATPPKGSSPILSLKNLRLEPGQSCLTFQVIGRSAAAAGAEIGLIGYRLTPGGPGNSSPSGTWPAPSTRPTWTLWRSATPPKRNRTCPLRLSARDGKPAGWRKIRAGADGAFDLNKLVQPNERVAVYALGWVRAPEERTAHFLLGSDDGARLWINGELVHSNPAYRAVTTDQDKVAVRLKKGWNRVLLKIVQGDGGFGFQARFADPDGTLVWSADPPRD